MTLTVHARCIRAQVNEIRAYNLQSDDGNDEDNIPAHAKVRAPFPSALLLEGYAEAHGADGSHNHPDKV